MMRLLASMFVVGFGAGLALGQVTLPNNTRRPEPKPAEPAATPTPPPSAPGSSPSTPAKPVPENFPGNLQPITAAAPLSDDVLTIEVAGLTMSLPLGSVVVQGANTEGTVYSIVAEDQSWRIEAQVHRTARSDATVHDTADLVIRNVGQLAPVVRPGKGDVAPKIDTNVELLQRLTSFTIPGCSVPGERMYLSVPAPGATKRMMGYTILKPLPTTFVVFELSCDETKFEKARAAYELSIATARFEDPSKLIAARAAALTAGTEFLSQLSEEKLARLGDGQERWFRWWRPGGGTDRDGVEVGYRVQTVAKGRRSDIGAEGGAGRDNPAGLVVTTQIRLLQRGAGLGKIASIIDSDTKAFCSFDRRDEAWVTTTVVRDLKTPGAKPTVFSETGVRSGTGMSIVTKAPGKADSMMSPTIKSTQYVSTAEAPLLASLLVLDAAGAPTAGAAGEYGFYAYRADSQTISLRRETVGRDPARANAWTVRSRSRDEKVASVSVFRDDGSLVRTELVDGSVWEPIEPDALLKLWKSRNLPVK